MSHNAMHDAMTVRRLVRPKQAHRVEERAAPQPNYDFGPLLEAYGMPRPPARKRKSAAFKFEVI